MDIDPSIAKQAAGPLGAAGAMLFMKGSWVQRLGMFIPGAALSYYGAHTLSQTVGLEEGLAGFLLGLFGMAIVAKVFETWEQLQLGPLITKWISKLLRIDKEGDA